MAAFIAPGTTGNRHLYAAFPFSNRFSDRPFMISDNPLHLIPKEYNPFSKTGKLTFKVGRGCGDTRTNAWVPSPQTHFLSPCGYFATPLWSFDSPRKPTQPGHGIRDVWACNLEDEFKVIRQVVKKYTYVAMDTEFPGVVARPIGEFKNNPDYQYQMLRCNVDLLKIIQLGLTFLDDDGKAEPDSGSTWQFNFKFNLDEDMYAEDSINLLQSSGIQFKKHQEEGVEPEQFAELLISSGVVLMDNIKWISFHSGYDFAYLMKLVTNNQLPEEGSKFFELIKLYFPVIYDVKYLMISCKNLKGGLQEVADQLELVRIGHQHQAGSDSLLTGKTFFKMKKMFFEDTIDDDKFSGYLYGLDTSIPINGNLCRYATFEDDSNNTSPDDTSKCDV